MHRHSVLCLCVFVRACVCVSQRLENLQCFHQTKISVLFSISISLDHACTNPLLCPPPDCPPITREKDASMTCLSESWRSCDQLTVDSSCHSVFTFPTRLTDGNLYISNVALYATFVWLCCFSPLTLDLKATNSGAKHLGSENLQFPPAAVGSLLIFIAPWQHKPVA